MLIKENELEFHLNHSVEIFQLEKITLELRFNAIRNKGFHFVKRDEIHSGISELLIDQTSFFILLRNEKELMQLKGLLKIWYQNRYAISEFTRNASAHRLIELEMDFDWKRLQEIKLS